LELTKVEKQVGPPKRDVDEVTNLSNLFIKSSDSCVGINALGFVYNPDVILIHVVR
jgi:hypothetical protein